MTRSAVPLRAIYRRLEESDRPDLPLLSVYRELGVIPREGREDNFNKASDDLTSYKVVQPGDLVLNKMKTWQGSLGVSAYEGIVSPAYFVGRRIADVDDRFMHHLLRSAPLIAEYGARSKGIRPSQWDLPWDEFASIKVQLPNTSVQRAIADYLDTETTRIDALIEKKQRMIDLVEESLVAWERELVASSSSRITPLRWRLKVGSGDGIDPALVDEGPGTPVIGGNGVMGYTALTSRVNEQSIAVGRVGALCGNVHRIDPPAWVTDNALWLRSFDGIDRDFLVVALRVADLNSKAEKTAQPLITGETVKSLRVPWPPLDEQRRVADEAEYRRKMIENLTRLLRNQILLLAEHRQALITAAVTGELKIEGVAA